MIAAKYSGDEGDMETVKLLLESRTNIYLKNNKGETFLSFIKVGSERGESCLKLAIYLEHVKLNFSNVLKNAMARLPKILLSDKSIRVKLLAIKWNLEKHSFAEIKNRNQPLFDYLGVYDEETLRLKITDSLKYMD
jgi:hypothetical protein